MNREDTVKIMAALNRAGILHVVEGQAEIWHAALADLDPQAALNAAMHLIRTVNTRVTPADIRTTAKQQHAAHAEAARNAQLRQQLNAPSTPMPPELRALIRPDRERETA